MSGAPLRVAVLGAGTVGREVVCALLERAGTLHPSDGVALVLTGIGVRDVDRAVERGLPAELLTDAPAHLVADDEADVIVELMGGDEPAHTLISAALSMGKSVVTANKHVLAHHGAELEATARRHDATLRFEAAVGGGIPVLGPLATDLAANRIERVRGIVNGTTNYILSAMTDEAAPQDYATALAEAQRLGYAEADPSGDVEGDDAVNKLVILARLAFDRWLDPGAVPTRPESVGGAAGPGITTVSLADQRDARAQGRIIRLLASASIDPDGSLSASVLPTALPLEFATRPHGRGPQPDRGRRAARRPCRVRRSRCRRCRDLVGGARRPHGGRPRDRFDVGPATIGWWAGRRAARRAVRGVPGDRERAPVSDR